MAGHHLRKEKNCLNCGAQVTGRYCSECGQENREPRENFFELAGEFVADLFHFDGKFFSTLNYLFLRPGFVSKEYILGRRTKYLNPIRMYIFTSAIFFLVYFTFVNHSQKLSREEISGMAVSSTAQMLNDSISKSKDSLKTQKFTSALQSLKEAFPSDNAEIKVREKDFDIQFSSGDVGDSVLAKYTQKGRESVLTKEFSGRLKEILNQNPLEKKTITADAIDHFIKSTPQMLFITLPLLALFLKLLYARRKHPWYYVDHLIFLVHVFIVIYILLLISYGFAGLNKSTGYGIFHWLAVLTDISIFIYPIAAMYNFYGQGLGKTLVKFFSLLFLGGITFLVLIIVFGLYFFFQI